VYRPSVRRAGNLAGAIQTFCEDPAMKKLLTMVFAGCMAVSMAGAFAAEGMKKDDMKKDAMAKDGMKKDDMKKDGMMKKDEMKK
jgi:pentapeptide MXKDX repeat protein